MMLDIQNLDYEGLTIQVDQTAGGRLTFIWKGRSTSREPGKVLTPYFERALVEASDLRYAIEMHFEDLEHFNSSTIAAVIQFINSAHSRNVDLVMHYDQTQKWQQLSFDALRRALKPFESVAGSSVKFVSVQR